MRRIQSQQTRMIKNNNTRMSSRQWAKKFIGEIAFKHSAEINNYLNQFSKEECELIAKEYAKFTKLLIERRGTEIY